MRRYAEGLVLVCLAIIALWGAWQVPAASPGDTWAGIAPFSAALGLLVLSAILLLGASRQSLVISGPSSTEPKEPEASSSTATPSIIGLFLIALTYQQSFRWFGYVLPTALVAPMVLYLFGARNRIGLAASIVLCPLVFHITFFELLGVFPPYGEVFDLLDWIKG